MGRIWYDTEQLAHNVPKNVYKPDIWSNGVSCEESELIVLSKKRCEVRQERIHGI
jgi:hypothetical protein